MVLRRSVLILLLLLLPAAAAAQGSCIGCHPAHHTEFGSCTHCHRGDPRTNRPELAHHNLIPPRLAHFALAEHPLTRYGVDLLKAAGCRRCHRSGGEGSPLASDLDALLPAARVEDVLASIRQPVLFMPDFAFPEDTALALVGALLANAARSEKPPGETPLVVHFAGVEKEENVFDKHCGACHRMLSARWGGLGSGHIAPNLSGLTGDFYPATFRKEERWSGEALKKWLKNPRAVRPAARMAPRPLTEEETARLLKIMAPQVADPPAIPPPASLE